jgi:magnesium chelatase subunit I
LPRFFQQKQSAPQQFTESAPPEKARSLRDLPENGLIKKETEC